MVLAFRNLEAGGSGIQDNAQLYRKIASSLRKKKKKKESYLVILRMK